MATTRPDFIALQVTDHERSARWYEEQLGLSRAVVSAPHAVVFDTTASFAVRDPLPDVDLGAACPRPGFGVALWMGDDDAEGLHERLVMADFAIAAEPVRGRSASPSRSSTPTGMR